MPALDTNVLVRYLIADDKKQFETAKALIESVLEDEDPRGLLALDLRATC